MEQNTSEINNHDRDPDQWDRNQLDKELVFDVLEEIPEVSSVGRSDKLQLFLLPLLALIIIAGIPLLLSLTSFNRSEASIDRDFPFSSLESVILRSAVQEINDKRREVDLKDVQIRRYQDRVLGLDNRLRLLQGLMEETLQVKEQDLLAEINVIVGEERSRLEGLGRTEEQINQALDRLVTNLESDYAEKMDEFRNQDMKLYEQRLTGLRNERVTLEEALTSAVEDRQALAKALDTDESELLAQLYEENEFIDIVNAGIDADLEILRESRKVEIYWLDELSNQYLGLIDAITTGDYNRAEEHLTSLENLISNTVAAELPGIKARNEADREIIRFFSANMASLENNNFSAILAESRLLIDIAVSHTEAGHYQEADIAWRRVAAHWPMMDQVINGYMKTRDELVAAEIRQYARVSESSLTSWGTGLEQIPDPIGNELKGYWRLWENINTQRLEAKERTAQAELAMERENAAARYDGLRRSEDAKRRELTAAAEAERQRFNSRLDELSSENRILIAELKRIKTELTGVKSAEAERIEVHRDEAERLAEEEKIASAEVLVTEEKLTTANQLISTLVKEIAVLETLLADSEAAANTNKVSGRWRLYGIIDQILDETLVIKPLINLIPSAGSKIRVMRSIGEDRVILLADGNIIEAEADRATSRLSSNSNGAEIYGSPDTDDLVYILAP